MSEIVILAVCFQLKQLKNQPEKKLGLNGIGTHDLAIPVQCSIHWIELTTDHLWVYYELTIDHLSMWLDSLVD